MKKLGEMSVGEVAAHVAGHLQRSGVNVVLTGSSRDTIQNYSKLFFSAHKVRVG